MAPPARRTARTPARSDAQRHAAMPHAAAPALVPETSDATASALVERPRVERAGESVSGPALAPSEVRRVPSREAGRRRNSFAVWGFVISIVSILLWSLSAIVSIAVAASAVPVGVVGLDEREDPPKGRGLADARRSSSGLPGGTAGSSSCSPEPTLTIARSGTTVTTDRVAAHRRPFQEWSAVAANCGTADPAISPCVGLVSRCLGRRAPSAADRVTSRRRRQACVPGSALDSRRER